MKKIFGNTADELRCEKEEQRRQRSLNSSIYRNADKFRDKRRPELPDTFYDRMIKKTSQYIIDSFEYIEDDFRADIQFDSLVISRRRITWDAYISTRLFIRYLKFGVTMENCGEISIPDGWTIVNKSTSGETGHYEFEDLDKALGWCAR